MGTVKTIGVGQRFAAIHTELEVVPGNVVCNAHADPGEPESNETPKPPRHPRLGGGLQARGSEKMGTLPSAADASPKESMSFNEDLTLREPKHPINAAAEVLIR